MLGDLQFCSSALNEIVVNGQMDGDISAFVRILVGCSPIDVGNIVQVDVEILVEPNRQLPSSTFEHATLANIL